MVRQGRQQKTNTPELPHTERQSSPHTLIDAESNSASIAPNLDVLAPSGRPVRSTNPTFSCLPTPGSEGTAQAQPRHCPVARQKKKIQCGRKHACSDEQHVSPADYASPMGVCPAVPATSGYRLSDALRGRDTKRSSAHHAALHRQWCAVYTNAPSRGRRGAAC